MKNAGSIIDAIRGANPPVTEDLPISSGTPLKIDCSDPSVSSVYIQLFGDAYITWALSDAEAVTNFSSGNCFKFLSGERITLGVQAAHDTYLYALSTGSAVTDGIRYSFNFTV